MKKAMALVFAMAAIIALASAFAASPSETLLKQYSKMDEESLINALSEKSWGELVNEASALGYYGAPYESLMYHAVIIGQKSEDQSPSDMIGLIESDRISGNAKRVLIEVLGFVKAGSLSKSDLARLEALLLGESLQSGAKIGLIAQLPNLMGKDAVALLERVWNESKDEGIAFQALRMIFSADRPKSWPIAEKALRNGAKGERAREAMFALASKYADTEASRQEKDWFIDACLALRPKTEGKLEDGSPEMEMDDTVAYALADMGDERAVSIIAEDNRFSYYAKLWCIDQCWPIILQALENPSQETLRWAIAAMNFDPVEPVYKKLKEILASTDAEGLPKLETPSELNPAYVEKFVKEK